MYQYNRQQITTLYYDLHIQVARSLYEQDVVIDPALHVPSGTS